MTTLTKDNIYKGMEVDDYNELYNVEGINVVVGRGIDDKHGIILAVGSLTDEDACDIVIYGGLVLRIDTTKVNS